jgi:hypothetical protein
MLALLAPLLAGIALSPAGDVLEGWIARSRTVETFSARYSLKSANPEGEVQNTQTLRLDYQAPDRMRMEMTKGDDRVSNWLHGTAIVVHMSSKEGAAHARVDFGAITQELATVQAALDAAFPRANGATPPPGSTLEFDWNFNGETQKTDFECQFVSESGVDTAFGWLRTLREKHAVLAEDGDLLRCSTDDGHFDVALAKSSGFLQQLVGRSPQGTMTVTLESLELGKPIEPGRLEFPADDPGEDIGAPMISAMRAGARAKLRAAIYRRTADSLGEAAWDSALQPKIESVLKPFWELAIAEQYGPWLDGLRKWIREDIVDYLRKLYASDAPEETIDAARTKASDALLERIDVSRSQLSKPLALPHEVLLLRFASEVHTIELAVAESVHRELIRDALLTLFDTETAADKLRDG